MWPSTYHATLGAFSFPRERRRDSHLQYMQSPPSNYWSQIGAFVSLLVRSQHGRHRCQPGHGRQVHPPPFTCSIAYRLHAALIDICKGLGISFCSQLKSITFRLPAHVGFAGHDDAWLAAAACVHLIPPSAPLEALNIAVGSCFIILGDTNLDAQKAILRYLDDAASSLRSLRCITISASDSLYKLEDRMADLFFSNVRSHLPKLQEKAEFIIRGVTKPSCEYSSPAAS